MTTGTLPVLMVLADQQDFYFKEYNDTKTSLEAVGLNVVVTATTTNTTYPHMNSGQGAASGAVTPDIALSQVNADDYSAIVFVGGWGSSMYQYAYNDPDLNGTTDNYYVNPAYNGDPNLNDGVIAPQKVVVNNLINDFLDSDKHVAAICHGVTVLAWARVDGVSPIAGKHVAVPTTVSAPDQFYAGVWRNGGYYSGQYDQVIANGAMASNVSGSIGNPATAADDVVVDGRIITGENFDSALQFGSIIAQKVLEGVGPPNHAPVIADQSFNINENVAAGALVANVVASDPDAGQSLTVNLNDLPDTPVAWSGNNLLVQGTSGNDVIYIWSGAQDNRILVHMNGIGYGSFLMPAGGQVVVQGNQGNDAIYATDARYPISIYGGGGHDRITGSTVGDRIDGGGGVDRIWGGPGDDFLYGGDGNDFLYGREGNDVLVGGVGNDTIEGFDGRDVLIGGLGTDVLRGDNDDDLLIGGTTSYDNNEFALASIRNVWAGAGNIDARIALLSDPLSSVRLAQGVTVQDDGEDDALAGQGGTDWFFSGLGDTLYNNAMFDRVS